MAARWKQNYLYKDPLLESFCPHHFANNPRKEAKNWQLVLQRCRRLQPNDEWWPLAETRLKARFVEAVALFLSAKITF